jgi:hypothetical protein
MDDNAVMQAIGRQFVEFTLQREQLIAQLRAAQQQIDDLTRKLTEATKVE